MSSKPPANKEVEKRPLRKSRDEKKYLKELAADLKLIQDDLDAKERASLNMSRYERPKRNAAIKANYGMQIELATAANALRMNWNKNKKKSKDEQQTKTKKSVPAAAVQESPVRPLRKRLRVIEDSEEEEEYKEEKKVYLPAIAESNTDEEAELLLRSASRANKRVPIPNDVIPMYVKQVLFYLNKALADDKRTAADLVYDDPVNNQMLVDQQLLSDVERDMLNELSKIYTAIGTTVSSAPPTSTLQGRINDASVQLAVEDAIVTQVMNALGNDNPFIAAKSELTKQAGIHMDNIIYTIIISDDEEDDDGADDDLEIVQVIEPPVQQEEYPEDEMEFEFDMLEDMKPSQRYPVIQDNPPVIQETPVIQERPTVQVSEQEEMKVDMSGNIVPPPVQAPVPQQYQDYFYPVALKKKIQVAVIDLIPTPVATPVAPTAPPYQAEFKPVSVKKKIQNIAVEPLPQTPTPAAVADDEFAVTKIRKRLKPTIVEEVPTAEEVVLPYYQEAPVQINSVLQYNLLLSEKDRREYESAFMAASYLADANKVTKEDDEIMKDLELPEEYYLSKLKDDKLVTDRLLRAYHKAMSHYTEKLDKGKNTEGAVWGNIEKLILTRLYKQGYPVNNVAEIRELRKQWAHYAGTRVTLDRGIQEERYHNLKIPFDDDFDYIKDSPIIAKNRFNTAQLKKLTATPFSVIEYYPDDLVPQLVYKRAQDYGYTVPSGVDDFGQVADPVPYYMQQKYNQAVRDQVGQRTFARIRSQANQQLENYEKFWRDYMSSKENNYFVKYFKKGEVYKALPPTLIQGMDIEPYRERVFETYGDVGSLSNNDKPFNIIPPYPYQTGRPSVSEGWNMVYGPLSDFLFRATAYANLVGGVRFGSPVTPDAFKDLVNTQRTLDEFFIVNDERYRLFDQEELDDIYERFQVLYKSLAARKRTLTLRDVQAGLQARLAHKFADAIIGPIGASDDELAKRDYYLMNVLDGAKYIPAYSRENLLATQMGADMLRSMQRELTSAMVENVSSLHFNTLYDPSIKDSVIDRYVSPIMFSTNRVPVNIDVDRMFGVSTTLPRLAHANYALLYASNVENTVKQSDLVRFMSSKYVEEVNKDVIEEYKKKRYDRRKTLKAKRMVERSAFDDEDPDDDDEEQFDILELQERGEEDIEIGDNVLMNLYNHYADAVMKYRGYTAPPVTADMFKNIKIESPDDMVSLSFTFDEPETLAFMQHDIQELKNRFRDKPLPLNMTIDRLDPIEYRKKTDIEEDFCVLCLGSAPPFTYTQCCGRVMHRDCIEANRSSQKNYTPHDGYVCPYCSFFPTGVISDRNDALFYRRVKEGKSYSPWLESHAYLKTLEDQVKKSGVMLNYNVDMYQRQLKGNEESVTGADTVQTMDVYYRPREMKSILDNYLVPTNESQRDQLRKYYKYFYQMSGFHLIKKSDDSEPEKAVVDSVIRVGELLLDKAFVKGYIKRDIATVLDRLQVVRNSDGTTTLIAPELVDQEHLKVDAYQLDMVMETYRPLGGDKTVTEYILTGDNKNLSEAELKLTINKAEENKDVEMQHAAAAGSNEVVRNSNEDDVVMDETIAKMKEDQDKKEQEEIKRYSELAQNNLQMLKQVQAVPEQLHYHALAEAHDEANAAVNMVQRRAVMMANIIYTDMTTKSLEQLERERDQLYKFERLYEESKKVLEYSEAFSQLGRRIGQQKDFQNVEQWRRTYDLLKNEVAQRTKQYRDNRQLFVQYYNFAVHNLRQLYQIDPYRFGYYRIFNLRYGNEFDVQQFENDVRQWATDLDTERAKAVKRFERLSTVMTNVRSYHQYRFAASSESVYSQTRNFVENNFSGDEIQSLGIVPPDDQMMGGNMFEYNNYVTRVHDALVNHKNSLDQQETIVKSMKDTVDKMKDRQTTLQFTSQEATSVMDRTNALFRYLRMSNEAQYDVGEVMSDNAGPLMIKYKGLSDMIEHWEKFIPQAERVLGSYKYLNDSIKQYQTQLKKLYDDFDGFNTQKRVTIDELNRTINKLYVSYDVDMGDRYVDIEPGMTLEQFSSEVRDGVDTRMHVLDRYAAKRDIYKQEVGHHRQRLQYLMDRFTSDETQLQHAETDIKNLERQLQYNWYFEYYFMPYSRTNSLDQLNSYYYKMNLELYTLNERLTNAKRTNYWLNANRNDLRSIVGDVAAEEKNRDEILRRVRNELQPIKEQYFKDIPPAERAAADPQQIASEDDIIRHTNYLKVTAKRLTENNLRLYNQLADLNEYVKLAADKKGEESKLNEYEYLLIERLKKKNAKAEAMHATLEATRRDIEQYYNMGILFEYYKFDEIDRQLKLNAGATKERVSQMKQMETLVENNYQNYPVEVYQFLRDKTSNGAMKEQIMAVSKLIGKFRGAKARGGPLSENLGYISDYLQQQLENKVQRLGIMSQLTYPDINVANRDQLLADNESEFQYRSQQVNQIDESILRMSQIGEEALNTYMSLMRHTHETAPAALKNYIMSAFTENDYTGVHNEYKQVLAIMEGHVNSAKAGISQRNFSLVNYHLTYLTNSLRNINTKLTQVSGRAEFNQLYHQLTNLSEGFFRNVINTVGRDGRADFERMYTSDSRLANVSNAFIDIVLKYNVAMLQGIENVNDTRMVDKFVEVVQQHSPFVNRYEIATNFRQFLQTVGSKHKNAILELASSQGMENLKYIYQHLDSDAFGSIFSGYSRPSADLLRNLSSAAQIYQDVRNSSSLLAILDREDDAAIPQYQPAAARNVNLFNLDDNEEVKLDARGNPAPLPQQYTMVQRALAPAPAPAEARRYQMAQSRFPDLNSILNPQSTADYIRERIKYKSLGEQVFVGMSKVQAPAYANSLYEQGEYFSTMTSFRRGIDKSSREEVLEQQRNVVQLRSTLTKEKEQLQSLNYEDPIYKRMFNEYLSAVKDYIAKSMLPRLNPYGSYQYSRSIDALTPLQVAELDLDTIENLTTIAGGLLSGIANKINDAQPIAPVDIVKIDALGSMIGDSHANITRLQYISRVNRPQWMSTAMLDRINRVAGGDITDTVNYFRNFSQQARRSNDVILNNNIEFTDKAIDALLTAGDQAQNAKEINARLEYQAQMFYNQIQQIMMKAGLRDIMGDPQARQQVRDYGQRASQQIMPRIYYTNMRTGYDAGFGGKFSNAMNMRYGVSDPSHPGGNSYFSAYSDSSAVRGGDANGRHPRLSSAAVNEINTLEYITAEDLEFLKNCFYDEQAKRIRFKSEYDQEARDLSKEEQMRYMKLMIRILVLFYAITVKELSSLEKYQVYAGLQKKFEQAGEGGMPKLIQAVNKMAEKVAEKSGASAQNDGGGGYVEAAPRM